MGLLKTVKEFVIDTPVEPVARWIHYRITGNKDYMYNRQTFVVMRRVLKRNSNFIDIGCNRGEILAAALEFSPEGKHWGFEAIPNLCEGLRARFRDRAAIVNTALSDREGAARFNILPESGRSGFKLMAADVGKQTIEIVIPTTRLDDIVKDVRVDMIKIDVNGAEYPVFVGAQRTISRWHPIIVFEHGLGGADQYHCGPEQVYDVLSACGMKLSTMALWLKQGAPFSRDQFCDWYYKGRDFQFIAF